MYCLYGTKHVGIVMYGLAFGPLWRFYKWDTLIKQTIEDKVSSEMTCHKRHDVWTRVTSSIGLVNTVTESPGSILHIKYLKYANKTCQNGSNKDVDQLSLGRQKEIKARIRLTQVNFLVSHIDTVQLCKRQYRCLVLVGIVLTHTPLTAATRVRYPTSACEMVMWSPSQTGGFSPGTPVSSHMKTIRTQSSVPTSIINISCITCFVIVVK